MAGHISRTLFCLSILMGAASCTAANEVQTPVARSEAKREAAAASLEKAFPHLLGHKFTITYDGKSSSDCIGETTSPQCVVETQLACSTWGDKNLCDKTGYYYQSYRVRRGYAALGYSFYEFKSVYRLTDEDIYNWGGLERKFHWYAGNLVVQVVGGACRPTDECVEASRNDPKRKYGEGCPATDCTLPSQGSHMLYVLDYPENGYGWGVRDEWFEPPPPILKALRFAK